MSDDNRLARGSAGLLTRILEMPDLVQVVQQLEPRVLHRLVEHVGLEDAGEIVALATTAQLEQVFDEDLWRSDRPGRDETFDPERFGVWLEVLMEAGEEFAARRLTELDPDLVTLAVSRLALVVDIEAMALDMADRGEEDEVQMVEKALESSLYHELDQYRIIARRHEGFDALVDVLTTLDRDHHEFLERLLERCCHIASEVIDEGGGLYQVLSAGETVEADAAAARETRREQEGFVAPSSAAAFLALARQSGPVEEIVAAPPDPITRAYFRNFTPRPLTATPARAPAAYQEFLGLLVDAEVLPTGSTPLLAAAPSAPQASAAAAMAALRDRDPTQHARRLSELGYLTNVLVAACPYRRRRLRPVEAADIALAVALRGLARLGGPLDLAQRDFITGFRLGWSQLHAEQIPGVKLDDQLAAMIGGGRKR